VVRTVRVAVADSPPQGREPSAWTAAEQLSALLLGSCFRVGIVWGLFLRLVRPLWLRDLGKPVWEPLVVILGFRPSSLLGEEFLSAPIHSPPLWSPNRSSSSSSSNGGQDDGEEASSDRETSSPKVDVVGWIYSCWNIRFWCCYKNL
jgi:hypothetical protein